MSFWDSLINAFKQGGNNSYQAGGGSAGSMLRPKGYKKARSTSQGKPTNLKSGRDRANRAASRRYQGQANLHKKRVAAERNKSIPFTGRAVSSGGGGGDVGGYDDGSAALQDALNQIGSMRTPDVEIPQINWPAGVYVLVSSYAALLPAMLPKLRTVSLCRRSRAYSSSGVSPSFMPAR